METAVVLRGQIRERCLCWTLSCKQGNILQHLWPKCWDGYWSFRFMVNCKLLEVILLKKQLDQYYDVEEIPIYLGMYEYKNVLYHVRMFL